VVPPHEHGLVAFGDGKALVAMPDHELAATWDRDGARLVFARNDGSLHAWRLPARRAPLPAPRAVHRTVEHADGRRRAVDVATGSGYCSQSALLLGADATAVHERFADGSERTLPVPAARREARGTGR